MIRPLPRIAMLALIGALAYRVISLEKRMDAMQREMDARAGVIKGAHGALNVAELNTRRIRSIERAMNGELPAIDAEWADVVEMVEGL